MKKLVFAIATIAIIFTACLKNELVSPILIMGTVTQTLPTVDVDKDVEVTAVVVAREKPITSVVIEWRIGSTAQPSIAMKAGPDNTYTATIPGQAYDVSVTWNVKASNGTNEVTSRNQTILWTSPADYTLLRLNEINGVISNSGTLPNVIYVELYNMSNVPMSLAGVEIWQTDPNFVGTFPGQLMWKGEAGQVIPAKGFFVMAGRNQTAVTSTMIFPGLSSSRALALQLRDPQGKQVDLYYRDGNDAAMNERFNTPGLFASSMGSVRIPDGTGKWYFFSGRSTGTDSGGTAEGTPGAPNPTSPEGLIKRPGFTNLVLEVPQKQVP